MKKLFVYALTFFLLFPGEMTWAFPYEAEVVTEIPAKKDQTNPPQPKQNLLHDLPNPATPSNILFVFDVGEMMEKTIRHPPEISLPKMTRWEFVAHMVSKFTETHVKHDWKALPYVNCPQSGVLPSSSVNDFSTRAREHLASLDDTRTLLGTLRKAHKTFKKSNFPKVIYILGTLNAECQQSKISLCDLISQIQDKQRIPIRVFAFEVTTDLLLRNPCLESNVTDMEYVEAVL